MNRKYYVVFGLLACGIAFSPFSAQAEHTRFYNLEGFAHLLDGNPESTAVSEDGTIVLPPPVRQRYEDTAAVFTAAAVRGDDVIVARAEDGQVLAVDRAGKTTEIFKAEETLVTAIASAGDTLYIAAGPPARIYRVSKSGEAKEFYVPDAGFVWGMAPTAKGELLLVTGEPGTVVQVDKSGNGTVLFSPEQTHMRSLWVDNELGVFAGGGERGVVYHAADGKTFRALFDSGHSEITGMVTVNNQLYVAGVTGAQNVVAEGTGDKKGGKANVRSQLVQVSMDGASETLAGSNDEAIFAVAKNGQEQVLVATGATGRDDPRGRLYAIDPKERMVSLIHQSESRRITHVVPLPRKAWAVISAAGGRITHVTSGFAPKGEFFSAAHDAGINAQFGSVEVFGSWPKGTSVKVAARSGQTAKPDETWSAWSEALPAPGRQSLQVPNGRYVQLRLSLESDGTQTPTVDRVRLAYLRQNLPPFIREVVALRKGLALLPIPTERPKGQTVPLTEPAAEDVRRSSNGDGNSPPPRARQVEQAGALTVKWVADDPNGDELRYDLMFRKLGDRAWTTITEELETPFYSMQSSQFPDGHYQFKVRATDAPSNPDGLAREDTRVSKAVLIDNAAPRFDPIAIRRNKAGNVTARVVVADSVGPLVGAYVSLNAREFRPIHPDDGVLDGPGETFTLRLGRLPNGNHSLTVRIVDEAGNEATGETVFSVP